MSYKNPKLTVDGVLFKKDDVLLIKRKNPPFQRHWALPGGFVDYGETTEQAVMREVFEETGLHTKIIKLLGVYSDPSRDPRGHTISVVYLIEHVDGLLSSGDDAADVMFLNIEELPCLAFDHNKIIEDALRRMVRT